jgi:hypothetical protein
LKQIRRRKKFWEAELSGVEKRLVSSVLVAREKK